MICRLDPAAVSELCPLNEGKDVWCSRADFTHAVWILCDRKNILTRDCFPLHQVLNVVLSFLRYPSSSLVTGAMLKWYAVTSVPWPDPELPLADFAVAFGPTSPMDESDESVESDESDYQGVLLPPRMAYELMCAAAYIGDTLHKDHTSFGMFAVIPKIARRYLRRSVSWRKAFQQCYFRIYSRLSQGLMPSPNCTGEEMALHTLFDYVQEDEHPNSKFEKGDTYWTLPQCPNDENYSEAKEYCLEDFDVLELFDSEDSPDESSSEDDGAEDGSKKRALNNRPTNRTLEFMQSEIGQVVEGYAYMHPEEWFEAFYPKKFWNEVMDRPPGGWVGKGMSSSPYRAKSSQRDTLPLRFHPNQDTACDNVGLEDVATAPVIQEVEHADPAAHVDPDVAASRAAVEWADRIEQVINSDEQTIHAGENLPQFAMPGNNDAVSETTESDSDENVEAPVLSVSPFGETIYLLRFTRTGRLLRNALDAGRALESLRDTAALYGQTCCLDSGAHIFVHPDQYEDVLQSLCQHELRPHHVVVSEAFLPLIDSDIGTLPSRANIRVGSTHPCAIVDGSGRVFSVIRTFIHARNGRSFDEATQSTSQARHIANPRA